LRTVKRHRLAVSIKNRKPVYRSTLRINLGRKIDFDKIFSADELNRPPGDELFELKRDRKPGGQ
jgi:hypothetical protein